MTLNESDRIKLELDQFKRELSSCNWYNMKLREVNLDLEEIAVKLYEVPGQSYEERIGSNNGYQTPKLALMLEEEELIRLRDNWESKINYCRKVLSFCSIDVKTSLIRMYILEDNHSEVAETYDYSRTGWNKIIDKELKTLLITM
ncbi:hypothetical protein [Erysipelothrix anatis]|uniref:hypothetical protein n=1 Tax=Erysipelothrix anatis TaxID=2683713 RepID=UPI00135C695D|nr:hypothetical protein [Erysipelothrix anatis]